MYKFISIYHIDMLIIYWWNKYIPIYHVVTYVYNELNKFIVLMIY